MHCFLRKKVKNKKRGQTMDKSVAENRSVVGNAESKSDKFVRLAEGRMTKVRVALARLDNLSNRSTYDYTEEQVNQMFGILEKELAEIKNSFLKANKEEKKFSFQ